MSRWMLFLGGGLALLVLWAAIYYPLYAWKPLAQAERHQAQLFAAMEDRDFDELEELFADAYADDWGYAKESALRGVELVLRHFFTLEVVVEEERVVLEGSRVIYSARCRLVGRGMPLAQAAQRRLITADAPTFFHWEKTGPRPWHWQLVRAENARLRVPAAGQVGGW